MKAIFNKKVKNIEVYKMSVNPLKKDKTFGCIWLENSDYRIKITSGKFYFVDKLGINKGIVLKSNKNHKKIKRIISIKFKNYRKNNQRIKY